MFLIGAFTIPIHNWAGAFARIHNRLSVDNENMHQLLLGHGNECGMPNH